MGIISMNVTEVPLLLFDKYIVNTSKLHCYLLFEITKVYFTSIKYLQYPSIINHTSYSFWKPDLSSTTSIKWASKLFIGIDGVTTI